MAPASRWLPGGHLQTIWPVLFSRRSWHPPRPQTRERWDTPDGDFIDVVIQKASKPERPMLVMFHGLEGSINSHYAQSFADWAGEHDLHFSMPHFRGCGGTLNDAPRAYHSGDHEEIDWILSRMRTRHRAEGGQLMWAIGVSLGGNALMRWAGEQGDQGNKKVDAIASICSPLDLMASGKAIGEGVNRHIYTPMFLRSMKPKAMAKWDQYPGLFDANRLQKAKDLYEFDNVFTAPIHGFKNTDDYWQRASAKPVMAEIRIPALALNPLNDPFVPAYSLPKPHDVAPCVELWQPQHGGHVGFTQGRFPGHVRGLPDALGEWLLSMTGVSRDFERQQHG